MHFRNIVDRLDMSELIKSNVISNNFTPSRSFVVKSVEVVCNHVQRGVIGIGMNIHGDALASLGYMRPGNGLHTSCTA